MALFKDFLQVVPWIRGRRIGVGSMKCKGKVNKGGSFYTNVWPDLECSANKTSRYSEICCLWSKAVTKS